MMALYHWLMELVYPRYSLLTMAFLGIIVGYHSREIREIWRRRSK